jgi:fluoroquinolone transport system ATP-binding protein
LRLEVLRDGVRRSYDFPLDGIGENADFLELLRAGGFETMHTSEPTLEVVFVQVTGKTLT